MFFTERSNSTTRHPHQFVGRVAIHVSPLSIIVDTVGMHSGVATSATRGGWPDGWLAAKGLRRGVAVVVSCGFSPSERGKLSVDARPPCTRYLGTLYRCCYLRKPCERYLPPLIEGVRDNAQATKRTWEVIGDLCPWFNRFCRFKRVCRKISIPKCKI